MNISPEGIHRIKRYRGVSLIVYDDDTNQPCIGYGHRLTLDEHFAVPIDASDAQSFLGNDLQRIVVECLLRWNKMRDPITGALVASPGLTERRRSEAEAWPDPTPRTP